MRLATFNYMTTGMVATVVAAIALVAIHLHGHPAPQETVIAPPSIDIDVEIDPSSSSVSHEPPPPPEGPFYASLFVAGATWTLPCHFDDGEPAGTQRCRVESVTVAGQTSTARIGCWYLDEAKTPDPAVNTYVMTPTGLYKSEHAPDVHGEPMFAPHPIAKSLPKGWGTEEPPGPTWADAMVRHHGAWCAIDEFQSEDTSAAFAECISRHGIVGVTHRFGFGPTSRCGDVPR